MVKNPPANAGDQGFSPWVRKILWRREWQPLQYSWLENPMDRGAYRQIAWTETGCSPQGCERMGCNGARTQPRTGRDPSPQGVRSAAVLHWEAPPALGLSLLAQGPSLGLALCPLPLAYRQSSSQPTQSPATSSTPGSRTLPPCLSFPSCHPGCRPGNALFTHGCFRCLQVTCLPAQQERGGPGRRAGIQNAPLPEPGCLRTGLWELT